MGLPVEEICLRNGKKVVPRSRKSVLWDYMRKKYNQVKIEKYSHGSRKSGCGNIGRRIDKKNIKRGMKNI